MDTEQKLEIACLALDEMARKYHHDVDFLTRSLIESAGQACPAPVGHDPCAILQKVRAVLQEHGI